MTKEIKSTGPGDQTGGAVVVSDKANKEAIQDQRRQMSKKSDTYKPFEKE